MMYELQNINQNIVKKFYDAIKKSKEDLIKNSISQNTDNYKTRHKRLLAKKLVILILFLWDLIKKTGAYFSTFSYN